LAASDLGADETIARRNGGAIADRQLGGILFRRARMARELRFFAKTAPSWTTRPLEGIFKRGHCVFFCSGARFSAAAVAGNESRPGLAIMQRRRAAFA
jgi:hypothetical protein